MGMWQEFDLYDAYRLTFMMAIDEVGSAQLFQQSFPTFQKVLTYCIYVLVV